MGFTETSVKYLHFFQPLLLTNLTILFTSNGTLRVALLNLDFYLYLDWSHFGKILAESIYQGICCGCFSSEMSRESENMTFLLCLKPGKCTEGTILGQKKTLSGEKTIYFLECRSILGGKCETLLYQIFENRKLGL